MPLSADGEICFRKQVESVIWQQNLHRFTHRYCSYRPHQTWLMLPWIHRRSASDVDSVIWPGHVVPTQRSR